MRYLRMLSNSAIAAALASGYLSVLVLQLNPSIAVEPETVARLALTLGVAYGVNLTVAFYALIVVRQILAVEVLSPGWLSVRLLSWLGAMAAGGGAAVMWLNLRGFGPVLDEATSGRMAAGAAMVSSSAVVFAALGLAHLGRRGGRVSASILLTTMALSLGGPLAARGPARAAAAPAEAQLAAVGAARPGGRVRLLMLDGASLDVIAPAVAAGRLPSFGRVFDRGAVVRMATLRPTQAETVWTAVATGRPPMLNGVRSSMQYRVAGVVPVQLLPDYCFAQALVRFGFVTEQPQSAADLTARPIWRILGDHGVSSGVIGWPLTHPAPAVNGFLVSDRLHGMSEAALDLEGGTAVWPPGLAAFVRAATEERVDPDPEALIATLGAPAPSVDYDPGRDPAPVVADRVHLQLLTALDAEAVRFLAVRFPGIDAVGHLFLRYADPASFGDVSADERRRFGRVLDEYYGFLDTLVGREMAALGADDLLLVVSAFGMEALTPGKRVLEWLAGNPGVSGTHERAPDGFVMAFGGPVAAGRPPRASVLDITPTVLYFLGLPVGRDMEGFARTDLFTPAFRRARPVTYIPSHGR